MIQCHVVVSEDVHPEEVASSVAHSLTKALDGLTCHLAFIFFTPHFSENIQVIVKAIQNAVGPRTLIGCMGAGVIGGVKEIEEDPGVIIWAIHSPTLQVVPFSLTPKREKDRVWLEGWPNTLEPKSHPCSFLLFADPFSTPIDELFSLVDEHMPGASIIGGIATGGMGEGESRLVLNDQVIPSGVVGVALQGGGLDIRTVVSQGCQPIGERYVVTKVDRNVIQELGGVPPLERLETTLREISEAERQQAAQGLQVGIAMDEHRPNFGQGDFLIRGLLGADRQSGSVAIADFVQEGQTIQFHVRDSEAAGTDLQMLLTQECMNVPHKRPKGALLFSCNGRGEHFFKTSHHDLHTLHQYMGKIPVAGFFAGGEIGPVGGKNYLHGYTASMALFYEDSEEET